MAKKIASITKKKLPKFRKKPMQIKGTRILKGKPTELMSEDRILAIIDRCWEMHSLGYFDREIVIEIFECFELEKPPTLPMIRHWLDRGRLHTADNLKKSQEIFKNKALGVVDILLRKWIPVAAMANLPILRSHVVNGIKVPYTDENAYDEQIKAATVVTKLLKEGRDILGIGHNNANIDGEALNQSSMLALIQTVNQYILAPGEKHLDKTQDILELESGLPDHQL